jgi:hypothetical protein
MGFTSQCWKMRHWQQRRPRAPAEVEDALLSFRYRLRLRFSFSVSANGTWNVTFDTVDLREMYKYHQVSRQSLQQAALCCVAAKKRILYKILSRPLARARNSKHTRGPKSYSPRSALSPPSWRSPLGVAAGVFPWYRLYLSTHGR